MVLGPIRKKILITLTDRSGMLFRMILGRKALEGDFQVDVGRQVPVPQVASPDDRAGAVGRRARE